MDEPRELSFPERREKRRQEHILGWLLLLPAVVSVGIIFVVLLVCFWLKWELPSDGTVIWLTATGGVAGCVWIGYLMRRLKVLTGIKAASYKWALTFLAIVAANGILALFLMVLGAVSVSAWK